MSRLMRSAGGFSHGFGNIVSKAMSPCKALNYWSTSHRHFGKTGKKMVNLRQVYPAGVSKSPRAERVLAQRLRSSPPQVQDRYGGIRNWKLQKIVSKGCRK